jgi:hypothetical protein
VSSTMRRRRAQLIEKESGRTADQWFALLDDAGAREMTRQATTRWLRERGVSMQVCMALQVEHEQAIGRREAGQLCTGDYQAAASRSFEGSLDEALGLWVERVSGVQDFDRVGLAGEPRISGSEKFRYWRVDLTDGTRVEVNVSRAPGGKASLNVQHRKLPDKAASDRWKLFWRELLRGIGG